MFVAIERIDGTATASLFSELSRIMPEFARCQRFFLVPLRHKIIKLKSELAGTRKSADEVWKMLMSVDKALRYYVEIGLRNSGFLLTDSFCYCLLGDILQTYLPEDVLWDLNAGRISRLFRGCAPDYLIMFGNPSSKQYLLDTLKKNTVFSGPGKVFGYTPAQNISGQGREYAKEMTEEIRQAVTEAIKKSDSEKNNTVEDKKPLEDVGRLTVRESATRKKNATGKKTQKK